MALSAANKADTVYYLGYAGKVLVTSSTHYDPTIAGRLENLNSEIEADVQQLLEDIEKLRLKLKSSTARMLVKQVGDIILNPDEHMLLQKEHKRLLRTLSDLLDIPLVGSSAGSGMNVSMCV